MFAAVGRESFHRPWAVTAVWFRHFSFPLLSRAAPSPSHPPRFGETRPGHAGGCYVVRGDAEAGAAGGIGEVCRPPAVCTGGSKPKSSHGCSFFTNYMQVVMVYEFCNLKFHNQTSWVLPVVFFSTILNEPMWSCLTGSN